MGKLEAEILDHVGAALEKNAGILQQMGAGLRGLRQGASQVAHNQKSRAALQGAVNTLHAHGELPMNVVKGVVQPLPMGVSVGGRNQGFFARASDQIRGAVAGAKSEYGATRAADQAAAKFQQIQEAAKVTGQHGLPTPVDYSKMTPAQYLQAQGHAVPAHHQTPAAQPSAPAAAPTRPAPSPHAQQAAPRPQAYPQAQAPQGPIPSGNAPSASAPNAVNPPTQQSWLAQNATPLALAAGGGAMGVSMLRGGPAAGEQDARMRDYMRNAQMNMAYPMPPMSVYASYDAFAEEKIGADTMVYPTMQGAMANSLANQLAQKFVGDPIDAVHKVLKKKLYDEPKHQAAFQAAIDGDEMLQQAHQENPQGFAETFKTLKTFAPSVARNPMATRTFLRQATMSGMHNTGPDFATIRMMTETEKFIQNAKGRGTP